MKWLIARHSELLVSVLMLLALCAASVVAWLWGGWVVFVAILIVAAGLIALNQRAERQAIDKQFADDPED